MSPSPIRPLGPRRLDQFDVPAVITGNEYIGMQLGDKTLSAQMVQVRQFFEDSVVGLVAEAQQAATDAEAAAQAAVDTLAGTVKKVDLAAPSTVPIGGFSATTAQSILDNALPLADYLSLLSYNGRAQGVKVTANLIGGWFQYNSTGPNITDGGVYFSHASGVGRWERIFSGPIVPEFYGALGDGITDDTAALRLFFSSSFSNLHLGGTGKIYLVGPKVSGEAILPLTSAKNIQAAGAVVKIKNASLAFSLILGSASNLIDLSRTRVSGIVFDHNSAGNSYAVSANLLTSPYVTFRAGKGDDIQFVGNLVLNAVCTNSVVLNGSLGDGTNVLNRPVVAGNTWVNIGGGATEAYDHSTIYTNAQTEQIYDNKGTTQGFNAFGTACFIETHGTETAIYDNKGVGFQGLINYTGVRTAGATERGTVHGNQGDCVQFGVRLFSVSVAPHTSGYGIDGLDICLNQIRIRQTQLPAGASRSMIGIGFQPGNSLPVRNVVMSSNTVVFDEEQAVSTYTSSGCGVGVLETTGAPIFENIQIFGNTVINSPAGAVTLGNGGGEFKNCHIGQNTLVNPGSGLNSSVASIKAGVLLFGNIFTGSLTIDKQTIIDNFPVSRLVNGVLAAPVTDSTACQCSVELDVKLTGANKSSFLRVFSNTSNRLLPSLKALINTPPSFTSHTFKTGSRIDDLSSDLWYLVLSQGAIWADNGYSSTAPVSGVHQVGSTRLNPVPVAGGTSGTVCVSAGTPGTWKAFGNIAA